MGQAYYYHQRLVLFAVVALLSAGLFPQALGKGKGKVCKSTAGRHASKYPVIDNLAVLNMQVDAFSMRTAQARKHVAKSARTIPPAQAQALTFCDTMYMNTQDTIGAAQRAITFKDRSTAKIMLQLAVQDFDSCDRPFTQAGIPNPMGKFDKELNQIANNCMALANMI
jgi:pectinesterase inhibitor-like protein